MENWQEFTEDTIAALLEDGSDPDALYTIEHHFYDKDFAKLEKLAVELFKLGYEVTDAEEVEFEDGGNAWVFDAIREQPLDADSIVADAIKLEELAHKHKVEYDGWGTYFESDEDEIELDDDEE
ncbi:ribonuclease E inhibitor RraB [Rheinheimera sp.]|jgi:regulator of ribonuclease activity B|uniref:ribonuclease E inhibitor RraB n=1 Tax=Rheinheimera sp. TaxID=1869214 RepID=UPI0027332CDB|nr:ribonuclease E inhibitor RraB [Rheinheimera sp.]MDP2716453.1 ribonuclease E inhibitor RraB [Rheinheimera sp.]